MLKNYINTIIRELKKNKAYTLLNVLGLAVGFASVLYISLYINHEISYDENLPNYERVFRLSEESYALTSPAHMEYLMENLDGMQNYSFVLNWGGFTVGNQSTKLVEERAYYASKGFFDIFPYPVLSGRLSDFNTTTNGIVITEGFAKEMFNDTHVLNNELTLYEDGKENPYKIVAVIKDLPSNTHMSFELMAHMPAETLANQRDNWGYTVYHGYLQLDKSITTKELQKNVNRVFAQNVLDQGWYSDYKTVDELLASGKYKPSQVFRVDDIYLNSNKNFELQASGNSDYLWVFGAAAIFILLLAAINFINLSTAQSAKKAKEVGVRKTLGSSRSALILQYLIESIVLCLIAGLLAVGLVEFFISFMKSYASLPFTFSLLDNKFFLGWLLIASVLTGVLSGIYPAFYLTAFKPVAVLKGQQVNRSGSAFFRNSLVVFQFTISLCLGIFMYFIYGQLNYGLMKEVGFERENMLSIDISSGQLGNNEQAFKTSIISDSKFQNAGYYSSDIFSMNTTFIRPVVNEYDVEAFRVYYQWIDNTYLPTVGVELLSGRNFDKNLTSDSSAVIINETALKVLGFENPIGELIHFGGAQGDFKIIGVMKDFHHQSMSRKIPPTLFVYNREGYSNGISIRLEKGDVSISMSALKEIWDKHSDQPMEYFFTDQEFEQLFKKEQQLGKIITIFTGLAFLVACLGLLGLAGYTAEQKTKEIGIRKVLGASVKQIVMMFSNRFIKLILISIAIASPLAYYITDIWLKTFVYRVDIKALPFILVGVVGLLIVLATVSYHMIKAATANPVNALKDE